MVTANVDLANEKVSVSFNPELTPISKIKEMIEVAGYKYLGIEGEEGEGVKESEEIFREKELREKRWRILIGFIVGIPLMFLGFFSFKFPFPIEYLMFLISTPAFIYLSYPIFKAGWTSLRNKYLSMDVMYSMGIGIAFLSSVLGTFGILLTKEFMFYDTAILLAAFLTLGRYLESKAKGRTSEAIKKLLGLKPKTAIIIRDGSEIEVNVEDVQLSDIVLVKPGGKFPVDGIVTEGESFVNESMITGEPIPVLKKSGGEVIGGTINKNSVIKFRAVKIGKDTMLSQIIKLVESAQGSKPPIQKIADKAVSWFIPVILIIAISAFVLWFFIFGETLLFALTCLISILVIACPCALGLATPTAVTVGIGRGAELGILIKNSESLEISEKLSAIAFDKTGTLTKGMPEVTDIIPIGIDERELLRIAATIEKNSQHPIADAIVRKALEKEVLLGTSEKFDTYEGKGASGEVEGGKVLIGSKIFFDEKNIRVPEEILKKIIQLENEGKTVILTAIDREISGLFAIADVIKGTSRAVIEGFKGMGLKVYMITGDNKGSANVVANKIGIENVIAEVLPQDKAGEIKKLQDKGEVIAFVGDGINDAPALAQADVGIAIGGGTDIAIESGDIVLVKNDLIDAVNAVYLSKKVLSRIKQNLFWAFAYNTALIPIAGGVLYPIYGITLRPEWAGLAMAMSSVTVVTLSLLLKRYIPPRVC